MRISVNSQARPVGAIDHAVLIGRIATAESVEDGYRQIP